MARDASPKPQWTPGRGSQIPSFQKNAHLISAAPELYKALFRQAGWFNPLDHGHEQDCGCGGCEAYRALAKAQGEGRATQPSRSVIRFAESECRREGTMTEPLDCDREMEAEMGLGDAVEWHRQQTGTFVPIASWLAHARAKGAASRPNLPALFEDDDWLWVAQSLGYVDWTDHDFEVRHRMDQIIAKILEYRAEDVRKASGQ